MEEDKKISIKEVDHIAQLARIEISQEEKEKFSRELSDVVGYVEQLSKADTKQVKPLTQIGGLINVLREDVVENCDEDTKKRMIDNLPDKDDKYIKVKQVM